MTTATDERTNQAASHVPAHLLEMARNQQSHPQPELVKDTPNAKRKRNRQAKAAGGVQPKAKGAPLTRAEEVRKATGGFCLCGCGAATNPKRFFIQGHDARLKGMLLRLERKLICEADLPKPVQRLLPTLRACACCGSPVWFGKSVCERGQCTCVARAAIAKRNGKANGSDEGEEEEDE